MSRPYAGAEIGDRQADRGGQAVRFARRCDFVKDAFGPVATAAVKRRRSGSRGRLYASVLLPTAPRQSPWKQETPRKASPICLVSRRSWSGRGASNSRRQPWQGAYRSILSRSPNLATRMNVRFARCSIREPYPCLMTLPSRLRFTSHAREQTKWAATRPPRTCERLGQRHHF
jgi:hypothetical protein